MLFWCCMFVFLFCLFVFLVYYSFVVFLAFVRTVVCDCVLFGCVVVCDVLCDGVVVLIVCCCCRFVGVCFVGFVDVVVCRVLFLFLLVLALGVFVYFVCVVVWFVLVVCVCCSCVGWFMLRCVVWVRLSL